MGRPLIYKRGESVTQNIAISRHAPGQPLPAGVAEQVIALFQATYLRYPYRYEIGARERFHLVALDGTQVLGYASFVAAGRYAFCAQLLVAAAARGRGFGRRIDHARYAWVRSLGLNAYVSCLCEDTASQRLKLELGLIPVNVKFGHQVKSFVSSEGLGTALVFAEGDDLTPCSPEIGEPIIDDRLKRVRVKLAEGATLSEPGIWDGWYLDVLTGRDGACRLAGDARFAYAGRELDRETGTWHYCFQLANDIYHRGVEERPALVCDAAGIARLHPLPST